VSSNPTNLVLAGAFSISFTTFTAFMILPFLAAAVLTYPVFLVMFRGRDYIPHSIDIQGEGPAVEPSSVLVDKQGAIFGSALFTVTLAVLVGTSVLDIPVWQVTVPPAVIMLIRDISHDWYAPGSAPQQEPVGVEQATVTSQMGAIVGVPPPRLDRDVHGFWKHFTPSYLTSRFPTATTVLKRLPVALVPFALLTFVLVQGLTKTGWVELFANGWGWWASHTGVVGVTAGMGIIACILCNVNLLYFHSSRYLTVMLDMRDQHRGDDLRDANSGSLDRPDGRFNRPKTTRRGHLLTRNSLELWSIHVHHMCFVGWASLEGHFEAKRYPRSPVAVLQIEPSVGRCFDGRVVCCPHWRDVCGTQELEALFLFWPCTQGFLVEI